MLEQQEITRLRHEEQIDEFRQAMLRLARVEEGLVNTMVSIDEDCPTVLRKLTSIENKVDLILEKDN